MSPTKSNRPLQATARLLLAAVFVCGVVFGPTAGIVSAAPVSPATMDSPLQTIRASVDDWGDLGNDDSWDPRISDDGRYVVFDSDADNLSDLDQNGSTRDVYMHDTFTRETTLISAPREDGDEWDRGSRDPDISGNGQYVVFFSGQDLSEEDSDTVQDIYRYDTTTGEYDRAAIFEEGGYWDDPWAVDDFYLSDDGRYVAFSSMDYLSEDDWTSRRDTYLYDFESQETTLVSFTDGEVDYPDRGTKPLGISDDGVYVLMLSGRDLLPEDNNSGQDLYRKNMLTGEMDFVDLDGEGGQPMYDLYGDDMEFSGDGRYVVFEHYDDLLPEDANPAEGDGNRDVYMWDFEAETDQLSLISYTPEGADEADRGARSPAISDDGSIVTFFTGRAFVPSDTNGGQDLYMLDTVSGEYRYIDVTGMGDSPGSDLYDFVVSGDGSTAAFSSDEYFVAEGVSGNGDDHIYVKPLAMELDDGQFRLAGDSRYNTAVKISQEAFPDGARTVIIATGENWPDALTGSALAGAVDGPILLTAPTGLSDEVIAEIERLGAVDAYILGDYRVVPNSVESELDDLLDGYVNRLAGSNRYSTAKAIANRTIALRGSMYDGTVIVSTGANFADAAAAAPLAAALAYPIVLADPYSGAVYKPADMAEAVILGSTEAVSQDVEDSLADWLGSEDAITRLEGGNRYQTAVRIAEFGVDQGMHWDGVGIATGQNFPDALTGGASLGRLGAVMLLTPTTTLDPAAETALTDNAEDIATCYVLGGPTAISSSVYNQIMAILGL